MDWVVSDEGAYEDWVRREGPSLEVELDMLAWYEDRRTYGPPALIDHSVNGIPVAQGPNGERIEHVVIPFPLGTEPPYATIAIRRID